MFRLGRHLPFRKLDKLGNANVRKPLLARPLQLVLLPQLHGPGRRCKREPCEDLVLVRVSSLNGNLRVVSGLVQCRVASCPDAYVTDDAMVDSLEGKGESRNKALAFGEVGRKNVCRRELWLMLASVPSRGGY